MFLAKRALSFCLAHFVLPIPFSNAFREFKCQWPQAHFPPSCCQAALYSAEMEILEWSSLSNPLRPFLSALEFLGPSIKTQADSPTVWESMGGLLTGLHSGFGTHPQLSNSWDGNRPDSNICLFLWALVLSIFANAITTELSIFYKCYPFLKRQLVKSWWSRNNKAKSSLLPSQGHDTNLIILRREADSKATFFVVVAFFSNPHL